MINWGKSDTTIYSGFSSWYQLTPPARKKKPMLIRAINGIIEGKVESKGHLFHHYKTILLADYYYPCNHQNSYRIEMFC